MNKEERIKRYGEAAYEKMLKQSRDWQVANPKKQKERLRLWKAANPDKVVTANHEASRKGGKFYEHTLIYNSTGLQGKRNIIRNMHRRLYHVTKEATPNSVFHHEWIPGTTKYRGVALVEKEAHQKRIIKVIKVLEGKITIFTEKEIKGE